MLRCHRAVVLFGVAWAAGCGGGGGSGLADTLPEAVARSDAADSQADVAAPEDVPDQSPAQDVEEARDLPDAGDAAADGEVGVDAEMPEEAGHGDAVEAFDQQGPPAGPSAAFLSYTCQGTYCNQYNECYGQNPPADCMEECVAKAQSDSVFMKKLLCARTAQQAYCTTFEQCPGDWGIADICPSNCAKLDQCGALGNSTYGFDQGDCLYACSGLHAVSPGAARVLECSSNALDTCDGPAFSACILPAQSPCEAETCNLFWAEACGLIPGYYPDTQACVASCQGWSVGQVHAFNACRSLAQSWGLECGASTAACLKVPSELPEGAEAYCKAYASKCIDPGDTYTGKLYDSQCAWEVVGMAALAPDLFSGFLEGPGCIAEWAECPKKMLGFEQNPVFPRRLLCVLSLPPEFVLLCEEMGALCEEQTGSSGYEVHCLGDMVPHFVAGAANGPQTLACMQDAGECGEMFTCL